MSLEQALTDILFTKTSDLGEKFEQKVQTLPFEPKFQIIESKNEQPPEVYVRKHLENEETDQFKLNTVIKSQGLRKQTAAASEEAKGVQELWLEEVQDPSFQTPKPP